MARHPYAMAVGSALIVLACVVLGASAWSATRENDADGRWELERGDHSVPAGLVIEIANQEVTGRGPCNQFRADWSQDSGASDIESTAMGCAASVLREEDTFFGLLADATSVEVDGDELRVTGTDGTLTFRRAG